MTTGSFSKGSALINVMAGAVQKAARGLVRDFGELENLQVSRKGVGDFVSVADHRSEKIIIQELQKARPSFGFITEETGVIEGENSQYTWIVDPLDGTNNFLHGIPHFCVTVALKKDDNIIAGVTYDPIKDELFWAEKGGGAYVNQRRLRVSTRIQLDTCLVGFGGPYGTENQIHSFQRRMTALTPVVSGLRRMGAAALDLAYVAAGKLDAFVEEGLSSWDVAAGTLLVQEAGGFVSDFSGAKRPFGNGPILACNQHIQKTLLQLIA
jgi:myo-inositol-1(or 4)-monophosphatase